MSALDSDIQSACLFCDAPTAWYRDTKPPTGSYYAICFDCAAMERDADANDVKAMMRSKMPIKREKYHHGKGC